MKLVPSLLAGALLLAGLTGSAIAGTATTTIPVTATVIPACAISAANMNFTAVGNISSSSGFTGSTSQTSLTVTCNASVSATIELDKQPMLNTTDNTSVITYNLFQDAAMTLPWGTATASQAKTLAAAYGSAKLTVYGQIPAQNNVVAGTYSAPITATVTF